MATDKNKHLDSVVKTHQIAKEKDLLEKFKNKNTEVKEALEEEYKDKLYSPFNSGSYAKNAAINIKFDFDLVAPYKRNAFDTLKKMYDSVYEFLEEKYKSVATVRKQKVSIGIEFNADEDGDIVKIDVVPGRELNQDQYKDDDNLNLYVYYQYGNIEEGSERIKSNIQAQIDNIKDRATNEKDAIRKNIRLLKVWKVKNNKIPKSFFLELITIKAFDNKTITGSIWDRLKLVMEYIRDEVTKDGFTLKDPGNSSNDIADTLNKSEKQNLSNDMKYILERIEENSDNIKTYFPENEKFLEEEDKYGNTGVGSLFSIPPKKERFG
jgi:hypothetical protein